MDPLPVVVEHVAKVGTGSGPVTRQRPQGHLLQRELHVRDERESRSYSG